MSAKWFMRKAPQNYALAFVAVLVAALIRYILDETFGFANPFVLFSPVITLAALLGGFGPGLFATMFSAVTCAFMFMEPIDSLWMKNPRDIVGLFLFVLMGIAISAICAQFRGRAHRLHDFQKGFEGLEEMLAVIDRRGRFLTANRAFLTYWDVKKSDLIGRRTSDVRSLESLEPELREKGHDRSRKNHPGPSRRS